MTDLETIWIDMTTTRDAIWAALDLLIERGGGTDYGVAAVLYDEAVRGNRQSADGCVVVRWIIRQLWCRSDVTWADLEVLPNTAAYVGYVSWDDPEQAMSGSVRLPPVLEDLATDFDNDHYPELEMVE